MLFFSLFFKHTKKSQFILSLSLFCFFFSDSLENIVSDFEETLNPRDYASDREAFAKNVNSEHRNLGAGYVSDHGPHIHRIPYTPSAQC